MNIGLIIGRYVKALYQLAEEMHIQEQVKSDMELLLTCIQESPEFVFFINTPVLKIREKKEFFEKMFSGKVADLTLKFLNLLAEKKREIFLKNICFYSISYFNKMQGVKKATITTAKKLPQKHFNEIFDFVTNKYKVRIDIKEKTDPSIIGGFILQMDDQQINASLLYQLEKIKKELIHT